jgi:hypothetical protein
MKFALWLGVAIAACVSAGEASAERILLGCEGISGKRPLEIEVDNGVVIHNGAAEQNAINITVDDYHISYFIDNINIGGLMEKYEVDLQTNILSWTGRKFEYYEAASARCERKNPFLRN